MKKDKRLSDIPPGEILFEDFLKPLGISQYRLAKEVGVPRAVSDYIAGMSDSYAIQRFQELFVPKMWPA